MKRISLLFSLLLASPTVALSDTNDVLFSSFPSNATALSFADGKFFWPVVVSNNLISVGVPLTAERCQVNASGKDMGWGTPGKLITLQSNMVLRLTWDRSTTIASADYSERDPKVNVIQIRQNVPSTNYFTLRLKKDGDFRTTESSVPK